MAAVGALPLGFKVRLGLARGKYLPAGLHAAEASYVSASSWSAFRAAIVRSVWSCKMPLANAPAVLKLLDGPVGVEPAYHIVWARFRKMRRYLACRLDEVPCIFRVLDLLAHGAERHGPVHMLLASEIGFAWDGGEQGWVRAALFPLRVLFGPVLSFRPGSSMLVLSWLRYRGFGWNLIKTRHRNASHEEGHQLTLPPSLQRGSAVRRGWHLAFVEGSCSRATGRTPHPRNMCPVFFN